MTQNNNQSMATVVETFIIEETSDLIHDNEKLDNWNKRVEELGLHGQKEVIVVGKSPIPFLWMNQGITATFETLCPIKVLVEKYSLTPIPVEILDLVSLSRNEQYFDFIEVWYNDQDKDPAVIGYSVPAENKDKEYYYQKSYAKKYLIGRWADVKESLDTLVAKAKQLWKAEQLNSYKQQLKYYQRAIEDIDEAANNKFGVAMPTTDLLF